MNVVKTVKDKDVGLTPLFSTKMSNSTDNFFSLIVVSYIFRNCKLTDGNKSVTEVYRSQGDS